MGFLVIYATHYQKARGTSVHSVSHSQHLAAPAGSHTVPVLVLVHLLFEQCFPSDKLPEFQHLQFSITFQNFLLSTLAKSQYFGINSTLDSTQISFGNLPLPYLCMGIYTDVFTMTFNLKSHEDYWPYNRYLLMMEI